jgi:hypothetical protein
VRTCFDSLQMDTSELIKQIEAGGLHDTQFKAAVNPAAGMMICSRVRELQETSSEAVISLEISTRNARRVEALQKRWERLRKALDELLDQRGVDMAEIPGGSTGEKSRLLGSFNACAFQARWGTQFRGDRPQR